MSHRAPALLIRFLGHLNKLTRPIAAFSQNPDSLDYHLPRILTIVDLFLAGGSEK